MRRLTVLALALAMAAVASACSAGDNANHSNSNAANANRANANAANANAANANTSNANTRRAYNANISEADYQREKDRYGREAKEAGETVGSGLKDGWLWVKAKGALAGADDLRDSTINVDIDNAVITLRGTVASAAQKTKAEQVAKVDGVTSVKNQITVAAGGGAAGGNSNNANHNAKGGTH